MGGLRTNQFVGLQKFLSPYAPSYSLFHIHTYTYIVPYICNAWNVCPSLIRMASSNNITLICILFVHREQVRGCVSAIHHCMLQESGALKQAGIPPSLSPTGKTPSTTTPKRQMSATTPPPSFEYLLEKLTVIHNSQQPSHTSADSCNDSVLLGGHGSGFFLPYLGPDSMRLFLEVLCRLFKKKSERVVKEKESLR